MGTSYAQYLTHEELDKERIQLEKQRKIFEDNLQTIQSQIDKLSSILDTLKTNNVSQDKLEDIEEQLEELYDDKSKLEKSEIDLLEREEIFEKNWNDLSPKTSAPAVTSEPVSIPSWFKNNAQWWDDGLISDLDMINALESLIIQDIIPLDNFIKDSPGIEHTAGVPKGGDFITIPSYQKDVFGYWSEGQVSDSEIINSIGYLMSEGIINSQKIQEKREVIAQLVTVIPGGNILLNDLSQERQQYVAQTTDSSSDTDVLRFKLESRNAVSQLDDINLNGNIAKSIFQTMMWNVATFSQLVEIKHFESQQFKEASNNKWNEYGKNKNGVTMDEAVWLETEFQRIDAQTTQALESLNYAKDTAKLAKDVAIKKGIFVIDLEDSVNEQQGIIDSTNQHFENISELKSTYHDTVKLQNKAGTSLQNTVTFIISDNTLIDNVLIGTTFAIIPNEYMTKSTTSVNILGNPIIITFADSDTGETAAGLNSAVVAKWNFSNGSSERLQLRDWTVNFSNDVNANLHGANDRFTNMRLVVLDHETGSEIATLFTSVDSNSFVDVSAPMTFESSGNIDSDLQSTEIIMFGKINLDKTGTGTAEIGDGLTISMVSTEITKSAMSEFKLFDILLAPEITTSHSIINQGIPAYEFQINALSGVGTNESGGNIDTGIGNNYDNYFECVESVYSSYGVTDSNIDTLDADELSDLTSAIADCDPGPGNVPITVLNIGNQQYPITQFTLWQWEGECGDVWHYHTNSGHAVSIDGITGIPDPDQDDCGFGKVKNISTSNALMHSTQVGMFSEKTGVSPIGVDAQMGGSGP